MMNKNKTTPVNKESEGEESTIAEIHAAMDDLCHQNQTLKDDIPHIQQRRQGINPNDEEDM